VRKSFFALAVIALTFGVVGIAGATTSSQCETGPPNQAVGAESQGHTHAYECAVPGPPGPAGPAGPAGANGQDGAPGPAGADGLQGPESPQGEAGPQGSAGPQGPAGAQGPVGPAGPGGGEGGGGAQGPAGAQGPIGPAGPQGPAGAQGSRGPAGVSGTVTKIVKTKPTIIIKRITVIKKIYVTAPPKKAACPVGTVKINGKCKGVQGSG